MRHPSSKALFAIWDKSRGEDRAPYRSAIPVQTTRALLGDMFVLQTDATGDFPLRFIGTRASATLGHAAKGADFPALFSADSRRDLANVIGEVADELLVAVAGLTASCEDESIAAFELTLLPFRARPHEPPSLIGLLVPMTAVRLPVRELSLMSWRYLGHEPVRTGPRPLRRVSIGAGLTVFEGLR